MNTGVKPTDGLSTFSTKLNSSGVYLPLILTHVLWSEGGFADVQGGNTILHNEFSNDFSPSRRTTDLMWRNSSL